MICFVPKDLDPYYFLTQRAYLTFLSDTKRYNVMRDTAEKILALDENNIEALQIFGKANVELGKKEENSCQQIQVGIKYLEKALTLCRNDFEEVRS